MKRFDFGVRRIYCFSVGLSIGLWWIDISLGFFTIQFSYNSKEDIKEYYGLVDTIKKLDEANDLS